MNNKVMITTNELTQGMVFTLAGQDYVITDHVKLNDDCDYVIHYALVNPNVLKQGHMVMPGLLWFEVHPD